VRESPANATVVRLWDLGRILGPKPSLFWIDGSRQNKNGFISKLVKYLKIVSLLGVGRDGEMAMEMYTYTYYALYTTLQHRLAR